MVPLVFTDGLLGGNLLSFPLISLNKILRTKLADFRNITESIQFFSILVGAPKWTSGQPGTLKSGAVYACKPDSSNGNQCQLLSIEYLNLQDAKKPPNLLHGKHLHPEGKNGQLLGFSVYSSGMREEESSKALVCAPLLRWGQNAYTDGLLNFLWGFYGFLHL
ncbi:unnamed protein product [Meloidogyne enterolobii]|uniref:Uncharacterized protein n=1 Tax=Meloidogyne enterolobii TaxID=390850 RepID=A0ACB1AU36_MELEN